MSTDRLARGFDRLAPRYDTLASVGSFGQIHASQIAFLSLIPRGRRALVLGGGTGRFLEASLDRGVATTAVSIDVSPEMTRLTATRLRKAGLSDRAELRIGSIEQIAPNETFDLIVTHCFLDLFDDAGLQIIVERLNDALAPGGLWLFSDFSDQRRLGRPLIATLYAFFRWTCGLKTRRLPDFDAALGRIGLLETSRRTFAAGLLQARLLQKS